MRLGQNDDGAQSLGLEAVVSTGDGSQSRSLGGTKENRLHGGQVVERMRLGATDLVADGTQAHRTHASTVATRRAADKRAEVPILAPPPSTTYGGKPITDGAGLLLADSASAASIDRAVTIAP